MQCRAFDDTTAILDLNLFRLMTYLGECDRPVDRIVEVEHWQVVERECRRLRQRFRLCLSIVIVRPTFIIHIVVLLVIIVDFGT